MIRTYFEERYAIKTLSESALRVEKTIKSTNRKAKIGFSLTNIKLGEKVFTKSRNITEIVSDAKPTSVKEVLIFSFFRSEEGRYLIKLFPSPNKLKLDINAITEIRVVPIPTCSGVKSLAFISQKKNPKIAITAVLAIRKIEFLYKESFAALLYILEIVFML